MIKAYVLVQAEVGQSGPIAQALRQMPGVQSADEVTGPYEVVATVEAEDVNSLGSLITRQIQHIAGIARTVTCTVYGD